MKESPTESHDHESASASDGMFAWLKAAWNDPSGIGKVKLAAIVVLVVVFFALFAVDGTPQRPQVASTSPDGALQPAAVPGPGESRDDSVAVQQALDMGDVPAVTAPPSDHDTAGDGAGVAESAPMAARGGSAAQAVPDQDPERMPTDGSAMTGSHAFVTEPVLGGVGSQQLITTGDMASSVDRTPDAVAPLPPQVSAAEPDEIAALRDAVAAVKREQARLEKALADSRREVLELRQQLEAARAKAADTSIEDKLKAQVERLQQQLNDLLDSLKDQIDKYGKDDHKPEMTHL